MNIHASNCARALVAGACVAVASAGFSDTITWVGESGNWSDAANWQNTAQESVVPAAGDDVVIDAAVTVTLDGSAATPALKSLTLGGGAAAATLSVANWNAAIVATTVTVADKGVLTCVGAFEKADMGRVWIQCADLTVAAGGKIDVSECGYLGQGRQSSGVVNGYGPGAGTQYGMGASHGGLGGITVWSTFLNAMMSLRNDPGFGTKLYDDPLAPVEPGSSGRASQWQAAGHGGGAVRIEASGCVTVAGSILASGGSAAHTSPYGGNSHGTAGAGGSVYITCETLAGAGVIRADGGDGHFAINRRKDAKGNWLPSVFGYEHPDNYGDCTGGGGMIAIHYAAGKQTAAAVSGMTVSAASGMSPYYYCCTGPTRANEDRYYCQADLGTLHFTDGTLVAALLGKGLTGRIVGLTEWTCDNLDFTGGFVRFTGEGFKLKVKGDLNVSGKNVRLDIGGVAMTNRVFRPEIWAGRQTVSLEVGGNLTVSDDARLDIRSAETNALAAVGAQVTVGKTLTVGAKGNFYAWCDPVNGGAPRFAVSNLTVAAGGLLTAEGRGYAGAVGRDNGDSDRYWNRTYVGYGPTAGFPSTKTVWDPITLPDGTKIKNPSTGGSHGGLGGLSTIGLGTQYAKYAQTCDDEWRPTMPGSGSGAMAMSYGNGPGGGVIFVEAKNHIQVDGTVSADAGRIWTNSGSTGGGAGGTIFLSAKTFAGAATGVLTARGGDVGYSAEYGTGCAGGGGGRIAVWTGAKYPGKMTNKRIGKYASAAECPACDFLGLATATGGTNEMVTADLPAASGATYLGGDGTVGFVNVRPKSGMVIMLKSR